MLRRLNSNQQSAKNQNTKPNSSTRKEAEAEEQINNSSGDNLINNILNTGNENAVKEILGAEKKPNNTDAEEAEGGLFDFFAEKADEQIIPEILKKDDTNKEDQKDGGNNIINMPENGKEIISTSSQKKYGQKKPEDNIFPGERPARQEFYEDPADLQEAIEFLGEEPDLTKPNDMPEDLRVRSGRKIKNKKRTMTKRMTLPRQMPTKNLLPV